MIQATNERPRSPRAGGEPMLRLLQGIPGIADIVWAIRSRAGFACDPLRIVFASSERRSGNSVLAAATAIALVRHLRVPVCLVEANVEHPSVAGYLGLGSTGLSDFLDGRRALKDCLQSPSECPGLYVLSGGTPRKPLSGELAAAPMRGALETLGSLGRYVVIDAPCVLDQLDSRVLLELSDAAVLVIRADSTRMQDAARVHRILLEADRPLLGSIFNAYGSAQTASQPDSYRLSPEEIALAERSLVPAPRPAEAPAPAVAGTHGEPGGNGDGAHEAGNGWTAETTGAAPLETGAISDEAHRREVDQLSRRIVKLTLALAQTEKELLRIAASKNIDLGVASIYRNVQGLAAEADALALKRDLMGKIFQANLELRQTTQRRS